MPLHRSKKMTNPLTMHAIGRMRSNDMSSTDKRRSNVLNGSGQFT